MKKWLFLIGGVVMGVIFTLVITIIANSEDNTTVDEVNNTTQVNNTSFFDEDETPGEILNVKSFKVFRVYNQAEAFVHGQDNDGYYIGTVYLLRYKIEDLVLKKVSPFYEGQIINVPKGKVARLFGTHRYFNNEGYYRSFPVVRIVDK